MASYKSQLNPPRRMEAQTPIPYRTTTTRLPQRSVTPTTSASQLPAPSYSKLQKKRSNRDEQTQSTRATVGRRAPSPAVPLIQSRPPAVKSTAQASSSRPPKLEVPRAAITPTPSLVSGSSVSTAGSPRCNVLRKKQSSIGVKTTRQDLLRIRDDSMSSQEERKLVKEIPEDFKDPYSETVLGISIPPSSTILAHADPVIEFTNPFNYDFDLGSTDMMPPVPLYTLSTTPSTRYSESPGPFSVSSTPTSMSSYSQSPGVTLPSKPMVRMRQASPLQSKPPAPPTHKAPEEHELPTATSTTPVPSKNAKPKGNPRTKALPTPPLSPPTQYVKKDVATAIRRPSQSSADKPRVQAPPELAHLAGPPVPAARRPSRPSRDGASEIVGLRGPSPIIQSNMTSFPSSHRRTPSAGSVTGATAGTRTRFGMPSKSSSRNPSPNPSLASGFAPSSRVPTRGNTPDLEKQRSHTLPTPAAAPVTGKSSRFGFFTRRKTEPTAPATKPEKKHRRGPAAGTGHEGYGRYALRGRSGSTGSITTSIGKSPSAATTSESLDRAPSTRKSSVTSTSSADMDGFFLDRLAPRVIRGTGSSTELTRSPEPMQSTSSLDVSRPQAVPAKATTKISQSDLDNSRPILLPSAMSGPVRKISPKKTALGLRRPSESDDDTKRSFIPSLSSKRTSRTSRVIDAATFSPKVPHGGSALGNARKVSVSEHAADEKQSSRLKSSKKDKSEKEAPKPARKWNFFQRAHAVPRVATPVVEPTAASPARPPVSRSIAHYALASESGIDLEDLEKLIEEDDSSPEDSTQPTEASVPDEPEKKERLHSMLLPPKPILPADFEAPARSASPKVFLHTKDELQMLQQKLTIDTCSHQAYEASDAMSQADLTPVTDLSPCSTPSRPSSPTESLVFPGTVAAPENVPIPPASSPPTDPPPSQLPPRPSRLAQVGRIPQVVSRRNQGHRSSRSFSRPFAADKPHPNVSPRSSMDYSGPFTAAADPNESFPILQGLNALTHTSAIATISPSAESAIRQSEFFKFPPRKDSEVSYSSSSGAWSFPPAIGTAVIPTTGAPQGEDEVWNEYDDLIDEVLSPSESVTSGCKERSPRKRPSLEPLPLRTKASRMSPQSTGSVTDATNSSVHLRRSRLLSVLHAQSPTSPISLSEFLQGYGERNISVIDPITGRLSFPSSARMSVESGLRNRPNSNRSSLPASLNSSARQSKATLAASSDKSRESATPNRYRDTKLIEIAEAQADGLTSMANLRFGALMTSKWLSFGRVLFSPAHFELQNPNEDRVLVVDGLGKDWSYYCALTYPEATVYNIGPGASTLPQSNNTAPEPWSTLTNHRHINHPSLNTAFPFPKGFFACVVLRFPSALPSSTHRFVISECKRVLRPGGHLELSVLDLDLVNMGNRARRAVRGLKVRMQVADENISLRNISDEIMGLVGRKGFTECNRCFVGVPVAGYLPDTPEGTPEARKRKGSAASSLGKATGSTTSPAATKPKQELSFSELLNMQSSSESTDNGIADMVARVGRWWYSRCYESLVLPEAGEPDAANSGTLLQTSIWRDEALIKECEKRGTSFRLLIGYAQKPEVGMRRTVSV